jgi:hypothetical protein
MAARLSRWTMSRADGTLTASLVEGRQDVDASLLIKPLVFFMAPTDPRMIGTNPRDGVSSTTAPYIAIRRNPASMDCRERKYFQGVTVTAQDVNECFGDVTPTMNQVL